MSMLRNLAIATMLVSSASLASAQGSGMTPSGTNGSPQGVTSGAHSTAAPTIHHANKSRHLYNKTASRSSSKKKIYNEAARPSKKKIYNRAMMKKKFQPKTQPKLPEQKPQGAQ